MLGFMPCYAFIYTRMGFHFWVLKKRRKEVRVLENNSKLFKKSNGHNKSGSWVTKTSVNTFKPGLVGCGCNFL